MSVQLHMASRQTGIIVQTFENGWVLFQADGGSTFTVGQTELCDVPEGWNGKLAARAEGLSNPLTDDTYLASLEKSRLFAAPVRNHAFIGTKAKNAPFPMQAR